jgi:hypothetical protein
MICSPAVTGQGNSTFGAIVEGTLTIDVPRKPTQVWQKSDMAKFPHKSIKVKDAHGKAVVYSGVLLKELLDGAGFDFGGECQDLKLGSYVSVEAVDDTHVIFALAELDTALVDKHVILADSKNGRPMSPPEGPYRIIVSDEKQPARWVRQVWAIFIAETFSRAGTSGCKTGRPTAQAR